MGHWLKLQLAEHQGISANVDCILPAAFLWRLYQLLTPEAVALEDSPFEKRKMALRIMRLISGGLELSPSVSRYLAEPGDPDLRCYQLSHEIADLFDQYLMYRPERMLSWLHEPPGDEASADEAWQGHLWRALLADLPREQRQLHRAGLHQQAMRAFSRGEVDVGRLPERLSLFGISTLAPLQLETLEALGRVTEVDLYFLNPCEHYWGDVVSPKDAARRSVRQVSGTQAGLVDEDYLEIGNPILSSLGKQGREFLELLLESEHLGFAELFLRREDSSTLSTIKNDILDMTYGGQTEPATPPDPVPVPDRHSVQLHVCHSRLREVEVLHDQILHMVEADPDLPLSSIIVMVPDIADYAPLVQTSFGPPLNYRISDRSDAEHSPLVASFLQLLDLPHSRFTGAEILDLLESPAVARKFQLQQADLDLLSTWINDVGIRWELDGRSKQTRWSLPEDNNNTWRFGLDRLLLGFARSRNAGVWQDTLGYDISPSDTALVGKLACIIDTLERCRTDFDGKRDIAAWVTLLSKKLDAIFDPRQEEVLHFGIVRRALEDLEADAVTGGQDGEVSFDLIRHLLRRALAEKRSTAGFLSGGITFATLVPMRSIPFKVVCLLGMNDGEYPRGHRRRTFDLMHLDGPRKGDRSPRQDDRYIFLEALVSADSVFYVSYVGKGIRDNQDKPPSVIVNEWRSYLESIFSDFRVTEHPLQPFSRKHYEGGPLQSFSRTWFPGTPVEPTNARFVHKDLARDESLELDSLAQLEGFFRHSGKYFMQQRLGVYFEQDDVSLQDTESFHLDGLERYRIADTALTSLITGRDLAEWEADMLASGQVMSGAAGKEQLAREVARAERIHKAIEELVPDDKTPCTGLLEVAGRELFYNLPNLHGRILLDYRVGALGARHLLIAHIRHLVASLVGEDITTLCISWGEKDKASTLTILPMDPEEGRTRLEELTHLYDEGLSRPLFLAPETGSSFVEALINHADEVRAMEEALETFQQDRPGAEGSDRYWQRLFTLPDDLDDEFCRNARRIWLPVHNRIAAL